MILFMFSITVLPVVKFHDYARDIAFNFIVNAQHTHQYLQRDIQQDRQVAWQAKTMAQQQDKKKAARYWKMMDPFPGDTRPEVKLEPINCQSYQQGLLSAWLCQRMSQLPIYSEEALQIRPAYHLDLMDEVLLEETYKGFYGPVCKN